MLWGAIFIVTGLIAAGLGGWWWLYRRSLPQLDGRLAAEGLKAPASITRDPWGVPHIKAESLHDAVFALGYCHAQDRLWQMEIQRRAGSGRLAELLGEKALGADRFLRRLGLRRAAQAEWEAQSPEERPFLEAYCQGVNQAVQAMGRRLPLEFKLLSISFEPYTPVDALTYPKLMAFSLGYNWEGELLRGRLIEKLGPEQAARLEPFYLTDQPFIVPPGAVGETPLHELAGLFQEIAPYLPMGSFGANSNSWVVSGERSVSGKPMLANDPHLVIQVPSVWYEAELDAPDYHTTGVTLVGVPGIVIGHNEHVSWGFTNSGADAMDLFLERFRGQRYEQEGEWVQADVIDEVIRVKGKPSVLESVYITRNGPVLSGGPLGTGPAVALKWAAHEPSHMISALVAMGRSQDAHEFRSALRHWAAPSQNISFADDQGNIGYVMAGLVPIRHKGSGLTPVPGWTGEYDWVGWVPFDELPQVFNPRAGYIATANNAVVDRTFPHHISWDYMNGFRAERITQMILERDKLSPADFAAMQTDVLSLPGLKFQRLCQDLAVTDPTERTALRCLLEWDGRATIDSVGCTVAEVTWNKALRRYFEPMLGDLTDQYLGKASHDLAQICMFVGKATLVLLRVMEEGGQEGLIQASLSDAVVTLKAKLGPDPARWHWGRLHQIKLNHPMASVPLIGRVFKPKSAPLAGSMDTVLQAAYVPSKPFDAEGWAPSYRQIIDMADIHGAKTIHTVGQSGQPGSKHYQDLFPLWLRGEYHPQLFGTEAVRNHAAHHLTLVPLD